MQVLGEGKPENQNAAMIYCFGECVQTVDMNQENRLAEAYKMRNLLSEFEPNRERVMGMSNVSAGVFRDDVAANAAREPIVALVGFREWIFSGKVCAQHAVRAVGRSVLCSLFARRWDCCRRGRSARSRRVRSLRLARSCSAPWQSPAARASTTATPTCGTSCSQ